MPRRMDTTPICSQFHFNNESRNTPRRFLSNLVYFHTSTVTLSKALSVALRKVCFRLLFHLVFVAVTRLSRSSEVFVPYTVWISYLKGLPARILRGSKIVSYSWRIHPAPVCHHLSHVRTTWKSFEERWPINSPWTGREEEPQSHYHWQVFSISDLLKNLNHGVPWTEQHRFSFSLLPNSRPASAKT